MAEELSSEDMKFLRDHPKGEVEVFECEYLGYPNSPWPVRESEKAARYRLVDGKLLLRKQVKPNG